jgi:hypothetical protein
MTVHAKYLPGVAKVYFLLFVWGPAAVGFSLGWLARYPHDWTGPAVIAPLGALLTVLTYRWGLRRLSTVPPDDEQRPFFLAGMIAGALVGLLVFGMLVLGIIG